MSLNIHGKCEGLRCPDFNVELENTIIHQLSFKCQRKLGNNNFKTFKEVKYNHEFKSKEIDKFEAKKKKNIKKMFL